MTILLNNSCPRCNSSLIRGGYDTELVCPICGYADYSQMQSGAPESVGSVYQIDQVRPDDLAYATKESLKPLHTRRKHVKDASMWRYWLRWDKYKRYRICQWDETCRVKPWHNGYLCRTHANEYHQIWDFPVPAWKDMCLWQHGGYMYVEYEPRTAFESRKKTAHWIQVYLPSNLPYVTGVPKTMRDAATARFREEHNIETSVVNAHNAMTRDYIMYDWQDPYPGIEQQYDEWMARNDD